MEAKEITKDDMETLRKVLKGDDEMSIVKTMQRLNLDFEDKVQSFSRLFEFCLHLHDSDNITFVAWNLCCEMCCCGPKTSKPVRATFIVTLMFHLHPNFELINHLYLLLPMRTTDKFNDVIQKKKKQTRNILPACYTWWRQRLRFAWLFYGLGPFGARQYVSSVIDTNEHCIPLFFVTCTWMLHVIQ